MLLSFETHHICVAYLLIFHIHQHSEHSHNCYGNASGTFTGMTYATSIPTTVVGTDIPAKLVGTVYFGKSYLTHGTNPRRLPDRHQDTWTG